MRMGGRAYPIKLPAKSAPSTRDSGMRIEAIRECVLLLFLWRTGFSTTVYGILSYELGRLRQLSLPADGRWIHSSRTEGGMYGNATSR